MRDNGGQRLSIDIRNFDQYGDARYTHAPVLVASAFCNGCCGCGVESGILERLL